MTKDIIPFREGLEHTAVQTPYAAYKDVFHLPENQELHFNVGAESIWTSHDTGDVDQIGDGKLRAELESFRGALVSAIGIPLDTFTYVPLATPFEHVRVPNLRKSGPRELSLYAGDRTIPETAKIRFFQAGSLNTPGLFFGAKCGSTVFLRARALPGLSPDENAAFFSLFLTFEPLAWSDLSAHEKMSIAKRGRPHE